MNIFIVFSVHFPFHSQGGRKANKLRKCNAVSKETNICSTNQAWSTVICHCNALMMMKIMVVRINQEAAPKLGSSDQSEIPQKTVAEDDDDNHLNGDDDNHLNSDDGTDGDDKDDDDDDDGAAITRARSK